ncbi:o-succinylbenzoate synthase [Mesoflavibacter sabulilitoris]|uniref:O-succinylbenzoate synthase n=1 Tax=Mesoflavibacter zeaxanthinifaciens subsp. sabulilitoris TaxID=1520893 RepID=A0A2T1NGW4_9FLAO|nr:o-succinylbenzoate synthase [Mesoflavibacter zeaxanthinifaciens]MBB3122811.1 o-succinylbenzoate synthase [Mesoflavibacter zeaxanthinifaciens subsp. sabulilitoris]PSG92108.1 o-succinylbenzoate synthase [Mesoflavibacter zeaxanthinifaciens subsp. sabulilitoris]
MKATYKKHILNFKVPSSTSRGILKTKETWFIIIENHGKKGIGECGILRGLSADDRPDYEAQLQYTCNNIEKGLDVLYSENEEFPSIQIGLEMAFKSLEAKDPFILFPSNFSKGNDSIPINGLIWMGDKSFMNQQIKQKIADGFDCIKLKIGAIDFQTELDILKGIRQNFSESDIEIRVDANGAFSIDSALEKLKRLSDYKLHSIEQPIKPNQWDQMAKLCEKTPLAIALDEELIGVFNEENKQELLSTINPQYIILKPSFIGGFKGSDTWISLAEKQNIGWWITSALESNVGLNGIAQYTYLKGVTMPQGLGTGSLFTNNISSPLTVKNGTLQYNTNLNWDFNF